MYLTHARGSAWTIAHSIVHGIYMVVGTAISLRWFNTHSRVCGDYLQALLPFYRQAPSSCGFGSLYVLQHTPFGWEGMMGMDKTPFAFHTCTSCSFLQHHLRQWEVLPVGWWDNSLCLYQLVCFLPLFLGCEDSRAVFALSSIGEWKQLYLTSSDGMGVLLLGRVGTTV